MKNIVYLIFLIINFTSCTKIFSDSIFVNTEPDTLFSNNFSTSLKITVKNISSDTLILINNYEATGFEDNRLIMPLASYYSPNIIYFSKINTSKFYIDGIFKICYDTLPYFLIILPDDSIFINFDLTEIENYLKNQSWKTYAKFNFTRKSQLDSLIINDYNNDFSNYKNKISYRKSIDCILQIESFNCCYNSNTGYFDKIKNIFNIYN